MPYRLSRLPCAASRCRSSPLMQERELPHIRSGCRLLEYFPASQTRRETIFLGLRRNQRGVLKMMTLNIAIATVGVSALLLVFAPVFSAEFALAVMACI